MSSEALSHHHHSPVAHHFAEVKQQHEAATLGTWLFLTTEILLFGGLFMAYTLFRNMHYAAFMEASKGQEVFWGALNTGVLICSSLTMALAVNAAEMGKRTQIMIYLVLTMILGSVFLGVKAIEYTNHWHHQEVPGFNFHWHGDPTVPTGPIQLFYFLYFVMTGLHAIHMVVGLGLLLWMLVTTYQGKYSKEYYNPVEMVGLYWHFVDIVWVFLFPLLYLIGRHQH